MLIKAGNTWHGYQPINFFNNPHQLGYYSLLVTSLLLLYATYKKLPAIQVFLVAGITIYLSISALSISSAIAISVGVVFYLFSQIKLKSKRFYSLVFISIVGLSVFSNYFYDKAIVSDSFSHLENKFDTKTTRDGGWAEGRGYDTLFQEPEYLFFGMGELPGRFYNEFHSILGNVFRSYGIIGLLLLLLFGYFIFKNKPIYTVYYFIPILVYGLAHNGIRQPFLWLYLAVVVSLFKTENKK